MDFVPSRRTKVNEIQPFAQVSQAFIRDRTVPAVVLAYLIWLASWVGYAANEFLTVRRDPEKEAQRRKRTKVRPIFRGGFGRERWYRTVRASIDLKLLERYQPKTGTRWGRVIERVFVPEIDCNGKFLKCPRAIYDGTLTPEETAVYWYVLAGTGKGTDVYAREIASRFGWSRRTATKVIAGLLRRGKLTKTRVRHKGRFVATTYAAVASAQNTVSGKNRKRQKSETQKAGNLQSTPSPRTTPSSPINSLPHTPQPPAQAPGERVSEMKFQNGAIGPEPTHAWRGQLIDDISARLGEHHEPSHCAHIKNGSARGSWQQGRPAEVPQRSTKIEEGLRALRDMLAATPDPSANKTRAIQRRLERRRNAKFDMYPGDAIRASQHGQMGAPS